jgi:hypothetical protein
MAILLSRAIKNSYSVVAAWCGTVLILLLLIVNIIGGQRLNAAIAFFVVLGSIHGIRGCRAMRKFGRQASASMPPEGAGHTNAAAPPSRTQTPEQRGVDALITASTSDDEMFQMISDEMDTGTLQKGIWIRLYAEAEGDKKRPDFST